MPTRPPSAFSLEQEVTLLDLLDRILDKGIVIQGDVTISVADVDLVYLGLKAVLASVDTVDRMRAVYLPPESALALKPAALLDLV
ncbi:MAG: gas vesicle protein [Bacteroidota bacterium]